MTLQEMRIAVYQQRVEELEREITACKENIAHLESAAEKEKKEKLNPVFYPKYGDEFYTINHRSTGVMGTMPGVRYSSWVKDQTLAPLFRTREAAQAYAEAFQVMLELRACEGVVVPTGLKRQWSFQFDTAYVESVGSHFVAAAMKTLAGMV